MTPPEYTSLKNRSLETLLERGVCMPFEKEYVRKDGRRVPVLIGASLLEREPMRWSSFVLDLTERKVLERQKEEFLATVSHDLQQPLAVIKARAQLLRRPMLRGDLPPPQRLSDGLATIVEQHGGRIDIESVEGRGSTLTVRLPLE